MTPDNKQQRIDALFAQAVSLPVSEQAEFLDRASANDPPEIRAEIEKLLAMDEQARRNVGFLGEPPMKDVVAEIQRVADGSDNSPFLAETRPPVLAGIDPTVDHPQRLAPPQVPAGWDLPEVGDQFGRFRILRLLGSGGMGVVFEAEDVSTGQHVALKVMQRRLLASPDAHGRFRREGILASRVSHPNCVLVLDADEYDSIPYIAMELMSGETLESLVRRRGPMDAPTAVERILDVVRGLAESHRRGVIHRDVKPSNCYIDDRGRVKIGDFGISKSLEADMHLTLPGQFVGTVAFSPPEQIKRQDPNERTDVYSVAATLYYLLAGKAPFEGHDAAATIAHIASSPVPPLREKAANVSKELEAVVLRGLQRDPKERWQTMEEFGHALLAFLPSTQQSASVGTRAGSMLLDWLLLTLLPMLLLWGLMPWGIDWSEAYATQFVMMLSLWLVYFTFCEGMWGTSLGKAVFELRVVRCRDSSRPGLVTAAIRVSCLLALWLPNDIFVYFTDDETLNGWANFFGQVALPLMAVLLMVFPMRKRNGYRGLHEWLSGTRVIQVADTASPALVNRSGSGGESALLPVTDTGPHMIGSYTIIGQRSTPLHPSTLVAKDSHLENRLVWIVLDPPANTGQRMWRPTRLAFLNGGTWEGHTWEAYLAPEGAPLPDWVPLEWRDARAVLEELADELTQACLDGSLPDSLEPQQVWISSTGHVQLVDVARDPVVMSEDLRIQANSRALEFLRDVSGVCLTGSSSVDEKHRNCSRAGRRTGCPSTRIPLSARHTMDRLFADSASNVDVAAFRNELISHRYRRSEVRRRDRALQLVILFLFLIPFLFITAFFTQWPEESARSRLNQAEAISAILADAFARDELCHALRISKKSELSQLESDLSRRVQEDRRFLERPTIGSKFWASTRMSPFTGDEELPASVERIEVVSSADPMNIEFRLVGQTGTRAHAFKVRVEDIDAWIDRLSNPVEDTSTFHLVGAMAGMVCGTVAFSVFPIATAILFRGGLSYWMSGLCIVRTSGRPAGRMRCVARSTLFWFVICLLCACLLWWSTLPAELSVGSLGIAGAVAAVSAGCVVRSLAKPYRCPHDVLLGTYMVQQ